jgi:Cu/Zn superoxide dismutase
MKILRLSLATFALGALAFAYAAPVAAATSSLVVNMNALNGSGENGIATLTQQTDGVKVVVALKNAPDGAQPVHIHIGTCANINKAPEYPLVNLAKGESTTVVKGITIDQLLAGHYAVNVHKSTDDLGTYVSCGDIKPAS